MHPRQLTYPDSLHLIPQQEAATTARPCVWRARHAHRISATCRAELLCPGDDNTLPIEMLVIRALVRGGHERSAMRAALGVIFVLLAQSSVAVADDLACVSTTFRFIGANDKVCVSAFDDPKVPGVACHISQARTGGISGTLGLAEDPSRFSIACRQVGPVATDLAALPEREKVYSDSTSVFFKHTHVFRIVDRKRNTLVYVAISDKIIEGSPQNALSTVPIMPWAAR